MSTFSPSDAAFEGFRLTRERPRAVVAWAFCYLVFTFLIGAVADLTLGPQSNAMLAELQRANTDPAAFWPAAQKLVPFVIAGLPLYVLFQAIFTCAIYRAVLQPEQSSRGYLRLGMDELRMATLSLILAVIWGGTLFVSGLVTLLAAATAGTSGGFITVLAGVIVTIAVLSFAITVGVRLSFAGPMTFAERRLRVFASWSMSRGVFWRLIGAAMLSLMLALVVFFLMVLVFYAALQMLTLVTGLPASALSGTSPSPLVLMIALASQVVSVAIGTCFNVVLKAWPAEAYKQMVGSPRPAATA